MATSLTGFVQQIATAYVPHGYWFYVQGFVPDGKDPQLIDQKLIDNYGIAISKWRRARRKRAGKANVQYIRVGRIFVILATKGHHRFFDLEASNIRDIRKTPIRVGGYSISVRKGRDGRLHAHVRIDQDVFKQLVARFADLETLGSTRRVVKALYNLPYEPYAPIRRQYFTLLRRINEVRKKQGSRPLPFETLPLRRRIVKPFVASSQAKDSATDTQ